jgi:hypothetical protein
MGMKSGLSCCGAIHADCDVDIRFFLFKLPDVDLVLARGSGLSINEARCFSWLKFMATIVNGNIGRF